MKAWFRVRRGGAAALAAILLAARAAAQTPGAGPAPPAGEGGADAPLDSLRDPFWPIGWVPPDFGQPSSDGPLPRAVTLDRWEDAVKGLKVIGLSRAADGRYFASIEGIGVVGEGDLVAVRLEGLTYQWRVKRITEHGLVPEKVRVFRQD